MSDTIRVVIPLTIRKRNGRPKILPPENVEGMDSRAQDPHVLRAIGQVLDGAEFTCLHAPPPGPCPADRPQNVGVLGSGVHPFGVGQVLDGAEFTCLHAPPPKGSQIGSSAG